RERADLRHVEPPPPDARVHAREPRREAPARWRDPSGRDRRGEDLAVRALRTLGVVLSVPPGRLSRDRRALAGELRLRRARDRRSPRRCAALRARARFAFGARCLAVRQGPRRAPVGAGRRSASRHRADRHRARRCSPRPPGTAEPHARTGPMLEVAVGVLVRADGAVLFGQRRAGKPYAGWWEFPGGKLEPGERVEQALARELREELGIEVRRSLPWVLREHVYPHAHVRLSFRRVVEWEGT